MSKEGHKELFKKFCQEYVEGPEAKQSTTKTIIITAEKAQKIMDALKGAKLNKVPSSFKFLVTKTRRFALLNYPELQLKEVLCLPAKQKKLDYNEWLLTYFITE